MAALFDFATLQFGDHLLYRGTGFWAWVIRFFSKADIFSGGKGPTHIETYLGAGQSFASRDGIGVNVYPLRRNGLVAVLRPANPLDKSKALAYAAKARGRKYDWRALLNSFGSGAQSNDDPDRQICSEAVTLLDRAAGFDPFFRGLPAHATTPAMFLSSPNFVHLWENF